MKIELKVKKKNLKYLGDLKEEPSVREKKEKNYSINCFLYPSIPRCNLMILEKWAINEIKIHLYCIKVNQTKKNVYLYNVLLKGGYEDKDIYYDKNFFDSKINFIISMI